MNNTEFVIIFIMAVIATAIFCYIGVRLGTAIANRIPRKRPKLNFINPEEEEDEEEEGKSL